MEARRPPSGIMALRSIEVSHGAVRDWKAKLLPIMFVRGFKSHDTAGRFCRET